MGIAHLKVRDAVDALVTIPNERLLQKVDPKTPNTEAFRIADDVPRHGIVGFRQVRWARSRNASKSNPSSK